MTEICIGLVGILFPVVFWTAYKVGKIEAGLEDIRGTVKRFIGGEK